MTDVIVFVFFLLGAGFCFLHARAGMRGGPLWIDGSDADDDVEPHEIRGGRAKALGMLYLLTGLGCLVAALRVWV